MEEKLKTKLSAETIDLVYHMIDWLYFSPVEYYSMLPYSKDEMRDIIYNLTGHKIDDKLHAKIKATR